MTCMYERLRELYLSGQAKELHLKNAIKKNWLTQEEYDLIIKEKLEKDKEETQLLTQLSK